MTSDHSFLRRIALAEVLMLCIFQLLYACGVSVLMMAWSVEHQDIERWYAGQAHGNTTYVESVLQGSDNDAAARTPASVHTFGLLLKTYSAVDASFGTVPSIHERQFSFHPIEGERTMTGYIGSIFRPPCGPWLI